MIIQLPHILQQITDKVASRVMRGWMELINRAASSVTYPKQSEDLTTYTSSRIVATGDITVTLNPNALEDEWVTVVHDTTGNVTITDTFGFVILTKAETTATLRYVQDNGWKLGA